MDGVDSEVTLEPKVLLVDPDPVSRVAVAKLLADSGIEVAGEAGSAQEALHVARLTKPTVVALDVATPGAEELAGKLRRATSTRTEVVAITGFGTVDRISRMVLSGASAFVVKGKPADLLGAIRSVSVGSGLLSAEASRPVLREVRLLYERERSRNERLEKAVSRLRTLSVTDPLTGLRNHGFFFDRLGEELERARRYDRPLAVVIADIDDFKAVNDTFGHAAGDRVLKALGEVFRGQVREVDIACRIGGEEFGFVLPETDESGAVQVAERVRAAASELDALDTGTITLSLGVAVFPIHADSRDDLVESADMALYQAKHEGKNCVRIAGQGLMSTEITKAHPTMAPVIDALVGALRLRSPALLDRSGRVADVSVAIGQQLGLSVVQAARLHLAALVHDVGMIGVPDAILLKEGPLDVDEWEIVRNHPHYGVELLSRAVHPEVIQAVLTHHERVDGTGYPNGAAADSIPVLGRALHAADAFVAMTSPRPYQASIDPLEALDRMRDGAGTDFDPDMVVALEQAYGEGRGLRLVVG